MNTPVHLNIGTVEKRVLRIAVGQTMLRLTQCCLGKEKEKMKNEKWSSHRKKIVQLNLKLQFTALLENL